MTIAEATRVRLADELDDARYEVMEAQELLDMALETVARRRASLQAARESHERAQRAWNADQMCASTGHDQQMEDDGRCRACGTHRPRM